MMINNRLSQEQNERRCLAPYAIASAQSKGRKYPEPQHPYRTCFQRDRDRIIHCTAFRRLEAKTQVFTEPDSDHYRTRLTHTIEVAQIARTMARTLGANEDLAESVSLAHDLGHPPYGHYGEAVLNELMADHGGFEHNFHSLRIVEQLEHPYPAFHGLNLTFETRQCLAKHQSRYDQPDSQEEYGPGHGPVEGQIADLADSIAYNSHDLEDALACGLIDEDALAEIELYRISKNQIEQKYPQANRYARQLRCAKGLIDMLVDDAIKETARRLEQLNPAGPDDILRSRSKVVAFSAQCQRQATQLEDFLMARVYLHPKLTQLQNQAGKELRRLFGYYVNNPEELPQRYRQRLDGQDPHRVICDYIAGMTDRFCQKTYQQHQK
jgi:dGTPase